MVLIGTAKLDIAKYLFCACPKQPVAGAWRFMQNAEPEGDEEPRYAGVGEAARAISALSPADLRRLELIARARSRGLSAVDWRDLLQESIVRTLDGSRRWPREVPLVAFLAQTIRSVASVMRSRLTEDCVGGAEGSSAEGRDDAHLRIEEAHQLRDIKRHFAEDQAVLDLIGGLEIGETAKETQARCGLTENGYGAARKRFWRGVATMRGE